MRLTRRVSISALILALATLGSSGGTAHADVAPPPIPTIGGPMPFEYQSTNVQMMYERVEMEVLQTEESTASHRIDVEAWFVMRNHGSNPEQMDVVFPLESLRQCSSSNPVTDLAPYSDYEIPIESFRAFINGVSLQISTVLIPFPEDQYCDKPEMSWASFPVAFPVGQDVLLKVEYELHVAHADVIQTVEYILQTGSGWRGPISSGHILVRFPYLLNNRNILSGTTPGYKILYNEISWEINNLEPTKEDDIQISFVSPHMWSELESYRERVLLHSEDADTWVRLAKALNSIAARRGVYRVDHYRDDIFTAYENGIAANPEDIPLLLSYALFLLEDCCYYFINDVEDLQPMLKIYDKILVLDPDNQPSWQQIRYLDSTIPGFEYTPPPTRTPTATALASATAAPSRTPRTSSTPWITNTPTQTATSTGTPIPVLPQPSPSPTPTPQITKEFDTGRLFLLLAVMAGFMFFAIMYRRMRK